MRYLRLLLFFALGFVLAGLGVASYAGTYPATEVFKVSNTTANVMDVACTNAATASGTTSGVLTPSSYCQPVGQYCQFKNAQGGVVGGSCVTKVYSCPNGGTLSGTTCTKTCPEGSPMQPDGSCGCAPGLHLENGTCVPDDKCAPTKDKYTSGWVSYTGDKVATGTVCIADCNYEQNIMLDQDDRIGTDGRKWAQVGQTGLGTSCTGSTTPSMEPDQKNKESKKPPCAATDGVLTTSTGKVLCVPEGTPDARKPDVKVKTKTETFPDNTTKQTTETTTRDPVTGATSTSTSSTSTGKADGTEGQAGPVGTTTGSSTSGSGNGDGDGEGCDPTLNFCGGPGTDGLYTKKEKTMASVFSQFQNTIKGSALGSASTGFFTVSTPGGSCPAWSVQVPMLNITLNAADYFCNGGILAALQGAGYVMLALATYIAFTWAFL